MASYRADTDVDAPPDEACAHLADHRNAVTWDSTVVSSEMVGDGPISVGSTFDAEVSFYGRRLPLRYTLSTHDCPESIGFDVSGRRVAGRTAFTIEPAGTGSRVTYELDIALTGMLRFLGRGLDAAIDGIGEKAIDGIRRSLAR